MSATTPMDLHSPPLETPVKTRKGLVQTVRQVLQTARRLVIRFVSYWAVTAVAIGAWEAWTRTHKSVFFPPFSEIFRQMVHLWFSGPVSHLLVTTAFTTDVGTSMRRLLEGWGLSVVIGVGFGVVLGLYRPIAEFCAPVMRFSMSVPATALLPVAVVLFGITDQMNTLLITFGTVWTVLVHTIDGVRGLDTNMMLTARSLRLSRARYFFRVVLPAASPRIFAGLRVSLGIGLILMVVSELFAATSGIGYFLVYSQKTFAYLNMWAAILLIGILGIVLNGLLTLVEHSVMRWHIARSRHVGER